MRIDVEDIKNTLKDLHGIEPCKDVMTFFYDESGNCRKFSLTEKGVNSQDSLLAFAESEYCSTFSCSGKHCKITSR